MALGHHKIAYIQPIFTTKTAQIVEILVFTIQYWYHDCRWPENTRRQGISSRDLRLFPPQDSSLTYQT